MRPHNPMPPARLVAPGGPVSRAIKAMQDAQRADDMRASLACLRVEDPEIDAVSALRALREALADSIEAQIAALDALEDDPDLEDGADTEPSLCGLGSHVFRGNAHACDSDREDGDDTGIGDMGGLAEQRARHDRYLARLDVIAASEATDRRAARRCLITGGAA